MGMLKIPEWVPDEIRLVLLCRAIRRVQKRKLTVKSELELLRLLELLDCQLAAYDPDKDLRDIRH
jgi:hypothetical protein